MRCLSEGGTQSSKYGMWTNIYAKSQVKKIECLSKITCLQTGGHILLKGNF